MNGRFDMRWLISDSPNNVYKVVLVFKVVLVLCLQFHHHNILDSIIDILKFKNKIEFYSSRYSYTLRELTITSLENNMLHF